jgi:hypothetical protein
LCNEFLSKQIDEKREKEKKRELVSSKTSGDVEFLHVEDTNTLQIRYALL